MMEWGLTGRYEHAIDAKGRVFVPAKLRDKLGECFVAAAVMDHCVCLYSQEEWNNLVAGFANVPMTSSASYPAFSQMHTPIVLSTSFNMGI